MVHLLNRQLSLFRKSLNDVWTISTCQTCPMWELTISPCQSWKMPIFKVYHPEVAKSTLREFYHLPALFLPWSLCLGKENMCTCVCFPKQMRMNFQIKCPSETNLPTWALLTGWGNWKPKQDVFLKGVAGLPYFLIIKSNHPHACYCFAPEEGGDWGIYVYI